MDSTRSKRTHRQGYPSGLGRQWLCDCEAESLTHLGEMSASGPSRRFDRLLVTSGLPLVTGHIQSPSACLKRADCGAANAPSPSARCVAAQHSGIAYNRLMVLWLTL